MAFADYFDQSVIDATSLSNLNDSGLTLNHNTERRQAIQYALHSDKPCGSLLQRRKLGCNNGINIPAAVRADGKHIDLVFDFDGAIL